MAELTREEVRLNVLELKQWKPYCENFHDRLDMLERMALASLDKDEHLTARENECVLLSASLRQAERERDEAVDGWRQVTRQVNRAIEQRDALEGALRRARPHVVDAKEHADNEGPRRRIAQRDDDLRSVDKALAHSGSPGGAERTSGDDRELEKHQPCGCVVCTCDDEEFCHGCGAKHCGGHPVGEIPNPVYEADSGTTGGTTGERERDEALGGDDDLTIAYMAGIERGKDIARATTGKRATDPNPTVAEALKDADQLLHYLRERCVQIQERNTPNDPVYREARDCIGRIDQVRFALAQTGGPQP